jgi:glycosyltransferase involved in cell wall biosynthesis
MGTQKVSRGEIIGRASISERDKQDQAASGWLLRRSNVQSMQIKQYKPARVSVVIPVYNAEKTVARAIDSVIAQDFGDYEIIAVDDGSADFSVGVLRKYGDRVRVLRQNNRGAASARLAGVALATAEYLAFLDADDEWLPGKLHACIDALDATPNAVLAYSDLKDPQGRTIAHLNGSPSLEYLLDNEFALFPSATVVRRSCFNECGDFGKEFIGTGNGFEDTFAALLLRELGEFVHIPEPLVVYYESPRSIMASRYRQGYRVFRRLVRKRYGRRGRVRLAIARDYYASLWFGAAMEALSKGKVATASTQLLRASLESPLHVMRRLITGAHHTAASKVG